MTTTTSIQHRTWDDIPAASKVIFYGKRYVHTPKGLIEWEGAQAEGSPQEELEALAQKFPERDKHGYIIGFYNYTPTGGRESGPHPTVDEAVKAKRGLGIGPYNTVCGHVFTRRGTIVRAN